MASTIKACSRPCRIGVLLFAVIFANSVIIGTRRSPLGCYAESSLRRRRRATGSIPILTLVVPDRCHNNNIIILVGHVRRVTLKCFRGRLMMKEHSPFFPPQKCHTRTSTSSTLSSRRSETSCTT